MKRDKNLVVLSHEHHVGLVFCNRLKKAEQAEKHTLQAYVSTFWDSHLKTHFDNEEKLFLPLLKSKAISSQFLKEHQLIRQLVDNIKTSTKEVDQLCLELSKQINDHIRFEERILFPWLESNLTPDELNSIGKALDNIDVAPHHFKPGFWKT